MSSSYLLNLKINQLQQEVQGIGESVGYFFNVTSSTGLVIDGGDSAVNISSVPNNTSWGASDIVRGAPWRITATVESQSNMWVGVSTDITQSFPSPSAPSMKMCNYGMLVDTDGGANGAYSITNGVINSIGAAVPNDVISIVYDGTTLVYTVNGTSIHTVSLSTLAPVRLVCGSYAGGQLNSITWAGTGSSGGGGGTANLEDVLTNGNNGGGVGMTNVGNITTSGNIVASNIKANSYLEVGNAVSGTSQLHLLYGSAPTNNNVQLVGDSGSDQLLFQFYNNTGLRGEPLKLSYEQVIASKELYANEGIQSIGDIYLVDNALLSIDTNTGGNDTIAISGSSTAPEAVITYFDASKNATNLLTISNDVNPAGTERTITYTFGETNLIGVQASTPNLIVQGASGPFTNSGTVIDSVFNPPVMFLNTSLSSTNSKTLALNTPLSILSFNIGGFGSTSTGCIYSLASMIIPTLNIAQVQVTGSNTTPLYIQLWLSDVQDADVPASNPINVIYTSPNVGFGGSPTGFKATKVLMSSIKPQNTFGNTMYLNCKIVGTSSTPPSNTFVLNGISFTSAQVQLQPTVQYSTTVNVVS